MNLPKIALAGVILAGVIYGVLVLFGLLSAGWPGLLGLIVVGFIALLFFSVLSQRMNNKEDDYYEKNVKD